MSVVEALQDRLRVLEDEILRLTKLASQADDAAAQDNYWRLAQDLQQEARELRLLIAGMDRGGDRRMRISLRLKNGYPRFDADWKSTPYGSGRCMPRLARSDSRERLSPHC